MSDAYNTWTSAKGMALAAESAQRGLDKVRPILRAQGSNVFLNVAPNNVSVRDEFGRGDYESFRRGEALPKKIKDIIRECLLAYRRFGMVRNIIDLMGDFAVQGIDLVHPSEKIEKFYKEWFKKVRGRERSERFLNLLYRGANVIMRRHVAPLPPEVVATLRPDQPPRRVTLPVRYSFFDILSIDLLDEELSTFVDDREKLFVIKIPVTLARKIKSPTTEKERLLVKRLPPEVIEAAVNGDRTLILDPENTLAFYYKKDDWQSWAEPMLAPVLVDLRLLEKMKLADMAALDGAISNIRVWKLGSLEHKILPSEATILRLAEVLNNNVGGGVMDMVWGPELELMETSTEVYKFLGETKYGPCLQFIHNGLGVPSSLSGEGGKGPTKDFLSLKTLIERLEYGRGVLKEMWTEEIRQVQKTMGFRQPAELVFDRMSLNDETAEKQLLMHLADRDYLSVESLQEAFDKVPEIEQVRIKREAKKRANGRAPKKAGPFHDPQTKEGLEKIFAGTGAYSPSEFGIELEEKKEGEQSPKQVEKKLAPKPVPGTSPVKGPIPGPGRPKSSADQQKRKKRVKKAPTKAKAGFVAAIGAAREKYDIICSVMDGAYVKALGRKNERELTRKEAADLERTKFYLLCQYELDETPSEENIKVLLGKQLTVPADVEMVLKESLKKNAATTGGPPTAEATRWFQCAVYALYRAPQEQTNPEEE